MFVNERSNDLLVFQIGFSRCATHSFQHIISEAGCRGIHFILRKFEGCQCKYEDGKNLYDILIENVKNGYHPIKGLDEFSSFFDMKNNDLVGNFRRAFFFHDYFPLLEKCYPNAKFIFNSRPIKDWISSCFYVGGKDRPFEKQRELFANGRGFDVSKIEDHLRDKWNRHLKRVREYFQGDKEEKILYYDINQDKPEKIRDFFLGDLNIDVNHWRHMNKTQLG